MTSVPDAPSASTSHRQTTVTTNLLTPVAPVILVGLGAAVAAYKKWLVSHDLGRGLTYGTYVRAHHAPHLDSVDWGTATALAQ